MRTVDHVLSPAVLLVLLVLVSHPPRWLDGVGRDTDYGPRILRSRPGSTSAVVLSPVLLREGAGRVGEAARQCWRYRQREGRSLDAMGTAALR